MVFRRYHAPLGIRKRPACLLLALLLVGAVLQFAVAHPSVAAAQTEEPPLTGAFAEDFILSNPPRPASLGAFKNLAGEVQSLVDYRGSVVLLNFWATWCGPCRAEMPSLDRLQNRLGSEGLKVLAVQTRDTSGLQAIPGFMARENLQWLEPFADDQDQTARAYAVQGLPSTFLIDRNGNLIGGLLGAAEWDSPDALALIRYYLDQASNRAPKQNKPAPDLLLRTAW